MRAAGAGFEVREATDPTDNTDTSDLQVSLQHGVIGQDAAQEAIMARWSELTRCYGKAGPAMGFAGGAVSLRFLVDAGGTTTDVRLVETRLGNFEAERCLLAVGRTVRFPRPTGNAEAQVDYTLEFRATGAIPVMELPAGHIEPALPALFGRLHAECERLGADQVTATVYLDAAGAVRSVGLASESSVDERAAACVAAAIRRWTARLEAVQGGVARVMIPLRSVDLVAHREPSPEVRRYSRASPTARARPRRKR